MNIYWTKKSIPALMGMTPKDRKDAIASVAPQVFRHWEVWLPFIAQFAAYVAFALLTPPFPYRLPIVVVGILLTSNLAALPMNHYLQYYLSLNQQRERQGGSTADAGQK